MNKFSKEKNREFWDKYALNQNMFGAHSDKHVVELENRFIISVLKEIKPKNILDLGCGNGKRTLIFAKFAENVTGMDYSTKMIEQAKKILSKQPKRFQKKIFFHVEDAYNIKNHNKKFDVIISCRCFINQPNHVKQLKLFKILHSKLNQGGSLIIAETSKEGIKKMNNLRRLHNLLPINTKWHNLPISESFVLQKINHLFKIKKINRLGLFFYISRIIHPRLVLPNNPNPKSKINDLAQESQLIMQKINYNNMFEEYGPNLLIHFGKK